MSNDEVILGLKNDIEAKRKELKDANEKIVPRTTCNVELFGVTKNFHAYVSDLDLVYLNAMVLSAKDLGLDPEKVMIGAFSLADWFADAKAYYKFHENSRKKRELNAMEKKLNQLLSEDKKRELEISSLADTLSALLSN